VTGPDDGEQAAKGGQEAADAVEPGWYPDPTAEGTARQRYWSGTAWTERVRSAAGTATEAVPRQMVQPLGTPAQTLSTKKRSDKERRAILAQQLQTAAARGLRIESQSDFQAVLASGQPVNNTLHAILTIFTCLLWGIVWAVLAGTGGVSREMVVVDEFGNIQHQKLGKA
jgi:hypothetical protein